VNQDGLKLNGTHQLLAYANDVNILGGSVHMVKENVDESMCLQLQTVWSPYTVHASNPC